MAHIDEFRRVLGMISLISWGNKTRAEEEKFTKIHNPIVVKNGMWLRNKIGTLKIIYTWISYGKK